MSFLTDFLNQCVVGKFIVHADLPDHLRQGMFAKPGEYDMIMRYSSLTPKIVPDNIPAPRGIGSMYSARHPPDPLSEPSYH